MLDSSKTIGNTVRKGSTLQKTVKFPKNYTGSPPGGGVFRVGEGEYRNYSAPSSFEELSRYFNRINWERKFYTVRRLAF